METQLPIGNCAEPRLLAIQRSLFVGLASFPFDWILLIIGSAAAAGGAVKAWRQGQATPLVALLVFFVANYVFILFMIRLNWPRYYLPTAVAAKLLIAFGIITLCSQLVALVRRKTGAGKSRLF